MCEQYHPEYKPEEGPPTEELDVGSIAEKLVPCPYCLYQYSEQLERDLFKYGEHAAACKVNWHIKGLPCDCGWEELRNWILSK